MAEDIPQKARVPAETAALRILQAQTGTANFAQRSLRQMTVGLLRVLPWAEGRAASVNPSTPVADLATQVGAAAIFLVRQSCWCCAARAMAGVLCAQGLLLLKQRRRARLAKQVGRTLAREQRRLLA